ncbi:ATP-binding protein [Exilibacterium tricleocarpae]|uniref:ATP-binding protein n=1 Tax=Exilibacterium tricleocarpae TaxID=2591008 RepID=A0A545U5J2_9GAMM|nr:ATP-binding protein [Exilibacterium tricleocarpae]TQV84738.1 ATP-binding protein [Exilibacterium tricleocarpae]
MSEAGKRSNRGDIYQTLIAFDWALTILSDPEYQWLEVDSTTSKVDDVVIGKSDGSLICCQCKKNQTDFKSWSISDLGEELDKAAVELSRTPQAKVRFYSRSEFGSVAKLCEYSALYSNETDYIANLTTEHTKTNEILATRIADHAPGLSTYEFLSRTSFEGGLNFDRMDMLLRERLRQIASNSDAAYNALWTTLDKLGGHMGDGNLAASSMYRLTKEDLKEILRHAGAMLVPVMSTAQVRTSFSNTSAIGRSWHRDVAGRRIINPTVNGLLSAIDAKERAILLTGLPGSGKTCVMLSLQEKLEQRMKAWGDLVPLFIQSREFADLATAQERQAQGLPEQWVAQAARLAEETHVVVVIDSLDVLSIAREHSVLTYFLAQVDQLLLIPNVTVVTACRDFDRKYDRRIATRQWDCEFQCLPLNWDTEIAPLLDMLGIDLTAIDEVTRELIRNPRELALFVELAQHEGSFSVVTSQALTQRYLNAIVQNDSALGDAAMQIIEDVADEMLRSRSLSIPNQRFNAPQDILRQLKSLNVLQDTHDGRLMFGHQTLLDALVVSRAIRQGVSLNEFIEGLPPVPFVRPSIRSFFAQLAMGERREFRKQLRTVLTSNTVFHIRRLIAELFAQQVPQDADWPLIRDLRNQYREVFQVVYTQASLIEWHRFWFSYLVPELRGVNDAEGLTTHAHRITQWINEDAEGVLGFWTDMLSLDWLDSNRIAEQLILSLPELETEDLSLAVPLIEQLLSMPMLEGRRIFLGRIIARCITEGVVDDKLLWQYIAGEISEEDITKFHFDNKLHCEPHYFGDKNDNFLTQRMVRSTALLDLALEAVEQWSQIQSACYGETRVGYRYGFLGETSYHDTHSETDDQHIDSDRVLMNAIEAAILNHAKSNSDWWQKNRERLCFNHEGALCYFAVLALTNSPASNLDLIGRLLCDKDFLEFELSFELGTLIRSTFVYLDDATQDGVLEVLQTIWEEPTEDRDTRFWILRKRAEYISAIPCHLRSVELQKILDACEKIGGTFFRLPSIGMRGGLVSAPFSYEVFLEASDDGVVDLLAHYTGYDWDFDNLGIGGEREVGWQLREASSRHPSRFLDLLSSRWEDISEGFSDEIMDGVASYLAHRYGNLRANNNWEPVEVPDGPILANQTLDELERHSAHWRLNRSAANALESCAHVILDTQEADRLVFLAMGYLNFREKSVLQDDSDDWTNKGINMTSGKVAEALMILTCNFHEQGVGLPELMPNVLCLFSSNEHPAIRALILRRLPYLQSKNPELGWELFHRATQNAAGLWRNAGRCLYYAYRDHFDKVAPSLDRIRGEGNDKDMEIWGRISALAALTGHIDSVEFVNDLSALNLTEAWKGAASVWSHPENIKHHREQCLTGIETGLNAETSHAMAVASKMNSIFRDSAHTVVVPINLIRLCFNVLESDRENKGQKVFGFDAWLNTTAQRDPGAALASLEIYLAYIKRGRPYFYDHDNQLVQLTTRLFAEAEEREESDCGEMLRRVVSVQDSLLSLGASSINDWLKAAERQ